MIPGPTALADALLHHIALIIRGLTKEVHKRPIVLGPFGKAGSEFGLLNYSNDNDLEVILGPTALADASLHHICSNYDKRPNKRNSETANSSGSLCSLFDWLRVRASELQS